MNTKILVAIVGVVACGASISTTSASEPTLDIRQQGQLALSSVRQELAKGTRTMLREGLVPRAGVEPATFPLGGGRSIQLSYRGPERIVPAPSEDPDT